MQHMRPEISLCMIVKDEEDYLRHCLEAISGVVDEMIILDTGSTDDTVRIASLYGAKIIRAEWNGDFAAARNQSLTAATKPWILVLDADEVWVKTEQSKTELTRLLSGSPDHVWGYWVKVTSLLGRSGEERVTDSVCRLFRNDPRIAFKGRIHEEIASSILAFAPEGVRHSELEVLHYGYLEETIVRKNKTERNMQLIRSALNGSDNPPELLYALAAEWFQQGEYNEALRLLEPLLARLGPSCGYHSDLVLKTAYALRESGRPERALAVVQAWTPAYADFADVLELGAVLELDLGREEVALDWLKKARSAAKTSGQYTSVSGAGTYRSLTLEGIALERLGRWEEAETAYIAALTSQPGNMAAWQRLLLLAAATGRPNAIADAAVRALPPPAAWQALVPAALEAHRPEWLLRHAARLGAALRQQPLATGLALAQLGEDAAARASLQPWAAHAQLGPEASLALWALGCKRSAGRELARAGDHQQLRSRTACALPAAAHAADALLRGAAPGHAAAGTAPHSAASVPRGTAAAPPQAVHAAAQALARVGAWAAWLRLLQALPPGATPALLAALPPAARCGLLRAPASVREGLLELFGLPPAMQQPFTDEMPATARATEALLAGTLVLLAGRQTTAQEWAMRARHIALQPAASGRPATVCSPGLHMLLRLTAPGAAATEGFASRCKMLFVHL
ncbi:glycosyltransferase family 2 protein [Paenibacillus sp. ACRRY]|uniref:glycosyltransferase family 2 protein n=1 Tax=Paenibacillus sp. ACRRY TaxID=2918208 RepID=UPI001EF6A464|nr:glycosyltransferase family 2 protein [Paenibacillus sp. ACRRY]MCG7383847.1 glycosyltransferase [Paenibacillus sp. ACRRY]